jgi:hypothetical protein
VITPVPVWLAGEDAAVDELGVEESSGCGGGGAVAAGVGPGLLVGVGDVGAGVLTVEASGTVGGVVGSGTSRGAVASPAVAGIGGGGAAAAGVEAGAGVGFPGRGAVIAASVGEVVGEVGGVAGAGVVVLPAAALPVAGEPGVWTSPAQLGGATIVMLTFTGAAEAALGVGGGVGVLDDGVCGVAGLEVGAGDAVCVSAGVGDWTAPVGVAGGVWVFTAQSVGGAVVSSGGAGGDGRNHAFGDAEVSAAVVSEARVGGAFTVGGAGDGLCAAGVLTGGATLTAGVLTAGVLTAGVLTAGVLTTGVLTTGAVLGAGVFTTAGLRLVAVVGLVAVVVLVTAGLRLVAAGGLGAAILGVAGAFADGRAVVGATTGGLVGSTGTATGSGAVRMSMMSPPHASSGDAAGTPGWAAVQKAEVEARAGGAAVQQRLVPAAVAARILAHVVLAMPCSPEVRAGPSRTAIGPVGDVTLWAWSGGPSRPCSQRPHPGLFAAQNRSCCRAW